ncbi:MAG: ribose 5-phosphate isomerase B [Christensenellales bacterium]|jgi:ribose 5-phosphate isomerase B
MKIAIGCDKLGIDLKNLLISVFSEKGHEFTDFGVGPSEDIDYPDIGKEVAAAVAEKKFDRGILICGTGIGMCITANKVKGAYAAVCHDLYSTQRSILSNNANIMCIGALVVGPATAQALTDIWLDLTFKDGRSTPKIQKIYAMEQGK